MTMEEMQAEIARIKAENEALKAQTETAKPKLKKGLTLKISEKTQCLCLYGLGRFPVSLYKGQWRRLIDFIPRIEEFMKVNDELLASKDEE